jgi:hypothetical protein
MTALRLIAGKTARERIEEEGLTPDLVRMVLGASGGPKWLVLLGLDRYIFGDWLAGAERQIDLVGSSIGGWRMTNAAHPNAKECLERFIDLYFQFRKSDAETPAKLTKASYKFLDDLLGDGEAARIIQNTKRNLNIVTVRSKGIDEKSSKWKEGAGILASAGANAVDRAYLAKFYERVVFHSRNSVPCPEVWADFERTDVRLTPETLADVLMATGSIPFVADPIKNIGGAPAGVYRDGGVIDYHFDIPWNYDEGIVLYPHFYSHIIPGWFDKRLEKRRAKGKTWDQLLLLAPSEKFVSALPGGKIPERNNFIEMTDKDRLAYWTIVINESRRLADNFYECLQKPNQLMDRLEAAPE